MLLTLGPSGFWYNLCDYKEFLHLGCGCHGGRDHTHRWIFAGPFYKEQGPLNRAI